jgi:hypothetical protein
MLQEMLPNVDYFSVIPWPPVASCFFSFPQSAIRFPKSGIPFPLLLPLRNFA